MGAQTRKRNALRDLKAGSGDLLTAGRIAVGLRSFPDDPRRACLSTGLLPPSNLTDLVELAKRSYPGIVAGDAKALPELLDHTIAAMAFELMRGQSLISARDLPHVMKALSICRGQLTEATSSSPTTPITLVVAAPPGPQQPLPYAAVETKDPKPA